MASDSAALVDVERVNDRLDALRGARTRARSAAGSVSLDALPLNPLGQDLKADRTSPPACNPERGRLND